MDNKKKQCGKVLYKVRYVLLFSMVLSIYLFIFSANSYAMNSDEIEYYLNYIVDNSSNTFINNFITTNGVDTLTTYLMNNNIDNCDLFTIINDNNQIFFYFFTTDSDYIVKGVSANGVLTFFKNNDSIAYPMKFSSGYSGKISKIDLYDYRSSSLVNGSSNNRFVGIFPSVPIYNIQNNELLTYYEIVSLYNDLNIEFLSTNYQVTPQNSIILTASSNHKFSFTAFNQLRVQFTGEWTASDFTFYVQKYDGEQWENYTSFNDYYILSHYDNPYYVYWSNMNYFPVGTYRYMAEYQGENTFSTVSDSFEILAGSVSGEGTANGSIDENGNVNIDVNIDNGNVVDNVKDFMGGPADFDNTIISQEDIENSLNIDQTVGPYDNFVLTFINGLIASLTDTSTKDFTFKVHTWGQTYTVKTSDIIPNYGQDLSNFLRLMSVIAFGFVLVKWSTRIVEALNVADVSKTLELVEEKYSNLL